MEKSPPPALNVLPEPKQTPLGVLFLSQFKSFLTALLILAASVSFIAGDFLDGSLIVAIILINGGIGFFQEVKARKDVLALKKMVVQFARVERGGKEEKIEAKFLVPGDIVILESGDKVPADGKIGESKNLTVDEASLTGESVPVVKEKGDEVFMATAVLSGRARFTVTKIGSETKFGGIALNLEQVEEEKTPLEIKMADLGKKIGIGVIILIGVLSVIGIMQGNDPSEVFFSGIALAVAAVPEGLPAVLTIALAVGVRRLARRKAIVKRLAATEALGSVDVIVSDKTGTLTANEMTVKKIVSSTFKRFEVSGSGYTSEGRIEGGKESLFDLLRVAVLCNSSSLVSEEGNKKFKVLGDTTEGSLLILALKAGINFSEVRVENPITEEIPFSLETRTMTVFIGKEELSKGAPEKIINNSNLTSEQKKKFLLEANRMATDGLRVLAFSKNKKFLGLVGISDPPRVEVKKAIETCKKAGIHVVMATGDYPETARAIALELGLLSEGDQIVSGSELKEYSDEVLSQNLMKIRVFARVTPSDKLRIVEAFQKAGKIVAVTGDGVNDAPALKRAQVGVAMGLSGTDVAKEAADLIITDDNFSTIVVAIEEGRTIFANLLKAIKFLLGSNLGEVLAVVIALILGLPMPLSPLALLWINVVSDGMPALALAVDSRDENILMKKRPELAKKDWWFLGFVGSVIAFITLFAFWFYLPKGLETARLVAFTVIVILDLIFAFLVRGKGQKLFANKFLILSVLGTLIIQMVILLVPSLRNIFV